MPVYSVITGLSRDVVRDFLAVPHMVYRGDRRYVPERRQAVLRHILPSGNPFLDPGSDTIIVGIVDGRPAGRLALRRTCPGERLATFGFFECIRDEEACRLMFAEATALATRAGMDALEGPYTPSTTGMTGIRLDGFDLPHVFQIPYSPDYYPRLLESSGLTLLKTGRSWGAAGEDVARAAGPDGLLPVPAMAGYELKILSLRDLRADLEQLRSVIEPAFTANWRYTPLGLDRYLFEAEELLSAVADGGVAIVKAGGTPAGAMIILNDAGGAIGRRRWAARLAALLGTGVEHGLPPRAVVYAIGLAPAYRRSSAGFLLQRHFARLVAGRPGVATTWIGTDNRASEEVAAHVGMKPWITLGVYTSARRNTAA